jgi:hypothetical protein
MAMDEVSPAELAKHIRRLLDVDATYQERITVQERHRGQIIWDGAVSVFSVDHPEADTCYAWSSPVEGSERRNFYAVLKKPPLDSPEAAVRAAIINDYRSKEAPK